MVDWLTETWTQWWFTPNEVKMQEIPQPSCRTRELGDKNFGVVYHMTHFSFFFFLSLLNVCIYFCCAGSFLHGLFSVCEEQGVISSYSWASHRLAFSSCGDRLYSARSSVVAVPLAPQHKLNGCGSRALLLHST